MVQSASIVSQAFYQRNVIEVARDLLGLELVSRHRGAETSGLIIESEAYLSRGDSACHGARGKTPGNLTMFGPAGFAYVYPIHGRCCFNVVTQGVNEPSAVLIRAILPLNGIETMVRRRGQCRQLDIARGPARLCQALAIGREHDGVDLTRGDSVWVRAAAKNDQLPTEFAIRKTRRIGVTSATEVRLRFVVAGCEHASGPRYMR